MTSLNTCAMCAFYRPDHSSTGYCSQHEKQVLGRYKSCSSKVSVIDFRVSDEAIKQRPRLKK